MAISDKTRKTLWGKSGNRCAICKIELVVSKINNNDLNIGEECHIISSKENGPRFNPSLKDFDTYDNLILLCRNHHKEIDSLVDSFPEEILRYMKQNHENWVTDTLTQNVESNEEAEKIRFLVRIVSGKDLLEIIFGAYGYRVDYDQPCNDEEAEYLGTLLQTFVDYGEISDVLEIRDKVKVSLDFQKILDELESKGYLLFGERAIEPLMDIGQCPVASLVIKRAELEEKVTN